MRLIKSKYEIGLMKKSAKISVDVISEYSRIVNLAYSNIRLKQILFMNSENMAQYTYTSIVASGQNACTLHYISNRDKMKSGQLLLTDAGCENEMYAADITRTIPVSGEYSKEQKRFTN